jgi:CHASE2 domain-containing sensor protein/two-component sensor histidine kinase
MQQNIWGRIRNGMALWRVGALPGFFVIALVITLKITGLLQSIEWTTLDTFLRLRPSEAIDERITIIGIDEADIRSVGRYPIPDQEIAELIRKLQKYKTRVIGFDIVRDLPVDPGHSELVKIFQESKNLIAVEKILPPQNISAPPDLPSKQIGFSDAIEDDDNKYRRILIGTTSNYGYKFSFSLRLAENYLSHQGITLEKGIHDSEAMRFGSTELPRFLPNSGGYVKANASGVKMLLNFRSGQKRFRTLSLNAIKTGNFNPNWIRDRIVMIGITTPSVPDFINTSAIAGSDSSEVYGVEFQAHAVSQIISAVLDKRLFLKTWSEQWEYIWILGWGLIAISLGWLTQSLWKNMFAIGVASFCLVGIGYVLLLWGWWIPVAPVLIILAINAVGLSAFAFYQYDRALKSHIFVRERAINLAFNEIHNGPLQTLAALLKEVQYRDLTKEDLRSKLQILNLEIRDVGEYLTRETFNQQESLRLGSGFKIDLKHPIHDLFYEVFSYTLERNLPYFQTLKVKARSFEPIEDKHLSIENKRELCQFLEEALCNVGKHAQGVTRLSATGMNKEGCYTLSIKDNGAGIYSSYENRGTKQSKNLAKQLGGHFKRNSVSPKGTLCELTWSLTFNNNCIPKIKPRLKTFFQKS